MCSYNILHVLPTLMGQITIFIFILNQNFIFRSKRIHYPFFFYSLSYKICWIITNTKIKWFYKLLEGQLDHSCNSICHLSHHEKEIRYIYHPLLVALVIDINVDHIYTVSRSSTWHHSSNLFILQYIYYIYKDFTRLIVCMNIMT